MITVPNECPIPVNLDEAIAQFRRLLKSRDNITAVKREAFICGWVSLVYIAPGLHPDESSNPDGGWPVGWKIIADEAFHRRNTNQLTDDELYPWRAARKAMGLPWRNEKNLHESDLFY